MSEEGELSLRVLVGALVDLHLFILRETKNKVCKAHTASLQNCLDILQSLSNELQESQGEKQ